MANYDRCVLNNKIDPNQLNHWERAYTVHIDCKRLVEFIQQQNVF